MFLFGKEKAELFNTLSLLEEKVNVLLNFYGNTLRLETQNKELFDRLMARNWDQWVNSPAVAQMDFGGKIDKEYVLSPTNDEGNIGGILSDEELGK